MTIKSKFKLFISLVILVIFGLFMFLNRAEVDVNLIMTEIKMSCALLILGVFGSGFLLGWIFHSIFRVRLPSMPDK